MIVKKTLVLLTLFLLMHAIFVMPNATNGETDNIEMISHRGIMADSYFLVFGEIGNRGTSAVEQVSIAVDFYDEFNTIIGSISATALLNVLMPGRRSPFIGYFLAARWNQTRSYQIGNISYKPSSGKPEKLALMYFSYFNGTLQTHILNNSTGTYQKFTNNIKVVASLYLNETIIGVTSDFLNLDQPGLGWDIDTTSIGAGEPMVIDFGYPFVSAEVGNATKLNLSVESPDFAAEDEATLTLVEEPQNGQSIDYRWIIIVIFLVLALAAIAYLKLGKKKRRTSVKRK